MYLNRALNIYLANMIYNRNLQALVFLSLKKTEGYSYIYKYRKDW